MRQIITRIILVVVVIALVSLVAYDTVRIYQLEDELRDFKAKTDHSFVVAQEYWDQELNELDEYFEDQVYQLEGSVQELRADVTSLYYNTIQPQIDKLRERIDKLARRLNLLISYILP